MATLGEAIKNPDFFAQTNLNELTKYIEYQNAYFEKIVRSVTQAGASFATIQSAAQARDLENAALAAKSVHGFNVNSATAQAISNIAANKLEISEAVEAISGVTVIKEMLAQQEKQISAVLQNVSLGDEYLHPSYYQPGSTTMASSKYPIKNVASRFQQKKYHLITNTERSTVSKSSLSFVQRKFTISAEKAKNLETFASLATIVGLINLLLHENMFSPEYIQAATNGMALIITAWYISTFK